MDSSGQIPPFSSDSSRHPEDTASQKEKKSLHEARRYTPDGTRPGRQDMTHLPDYKVSSVESLPQQTSASLPDRCPDWFKGDEDLFNELAYYQQYFTNPQNHTAFLRGEGPCYNPLIIAKLRLQTIYRTDPLTSQQQSAIEEWQDAALKDCPIPWRMLPLKLNHLNKEWSPSPQARRFIEFDANNRLAQENAGDFVPDWMKQEILGVPIKTATNGYWNLRNTNFRPGKNFLTIERLKSMDPVLYNWLALFKDPRVLKESGLSDHQIAAVEHELSLADEVITRFLKNKKCKTKSYYYTWKDIAAEPGLYDEVQQLLKMPEPHESSQTPVTKKGGLEQSGKKRNHSDSEALPEHFDDPSISPPAIKKKQPSEDSRNPDRLSRQTIYPEPRTYDFETLSESQIPQWLPSSTHPSEPESVESSKVVFNEINVARNLFPILNIDSPGSSMEVPVELVIKKLESLSSDLYRSQELQDAEKIFDDLKPIQQALSAHFEKVYQQHSEEMYASLDEQYKNAQLDIETFLSKEQHDVHEQILRAQEELSLSKFQAEYCLKRLRQPPGVRSEIWQTAELLTHPMDKTRECLLGKADPVDETRSTTEDQIIIPAKYFTGLRHHKAISPDAPFKEVTLSPSALHHVTMKNLEYLRNKFKDNMGVWNTDAAEAECDNLLIVFDYLIEHLKHKRAKGTAAFHHYAAMENLRSDFQNFRNALMGTDHTEMLLILSNQIKKTSDVIKALSSQQQR